MISVDKSHGELYAADAVELLNELRGRCKYGK